MASFMNTMFVPRPSPPQPFSLFPRPLPALHCNVLAESESAMHLARPSSPASVYQSPLQRHIQSVFHDGDGDSDHHHHHHHPSDTGAAAPALHNIFLPARDAAGQRQPLFLAGNGGAGGLWDIGRKADLLTRSNSNARARNNPAAFQPTKRARGTNSWQLKQFAEATLGSGSLRKVVQLPEGEDRDEWLAVNLVDFYNQINLLYGAITEFCSPASCPEMKATDEFEYLWHDPPAYPKPTRLPAPTYIGLLLTWASAQLANPAVFPTQPGLPFPDGFERTVRVLFKRLYRVYAHIYCHHYSVVRGLGLEAHLNTGFKHYVLFVEEFGLADEKGAKKGEWFGPLGELVESMLRSE